MNLPKKSGMGSVYCSEISFSTNFNTQMLVKVFPQISIHMKMQVLARICLIVVVIVTQKQISHTFNNPTRTIHAPYSQGSIEIFGENAGHQCVPMSLCSLIYVYRKNNLVLEPSDLVNIMNLGNQLYSALSRLSKQRYLLLKNCPRW